MTTTFKLFHPSGDCRRITFDAIPDLSAINAVVDDMVKVPVDRRQLSYIDGEGDRVVIKTSRDVAEAARDARDSGAATVKVQVRRSPNAAGDTSQRTGEGSSRHSNARLYSSSYSGGCPRGKAAPQCGHRGLFSRPPFAYVELDLSNDFKEMSDIFDALFPHIFVHTPGHTAAATAGKDAEGTQAPTEGPTEHDAEVKPAQATAQATGAGPTAAADTTATAVTTVEVQDVEEQGTAEGFVKIEAEADAPAPGLSVPSEKNGGRVEAGSDDLASKAGLLREMGFDIPTDVAQKMIQEMGGRMDLIVRALVANNK